MDSKEGSEIVRGLRSRLPMESGFWASVWSFFKFLPFFFALLLLGIIKGALAVSVHSSPLLCNKSMDWNCFGGWFHTVLSLFHKFNQSVHVLCCAC